MIPDEEGSTLLVSVGALLSRSGFERRPDWTNSAPEGFFICFSFTVAQLS